MTCANHPEITATAFCRECGKPMCPECQRPALGSIFCEVHQPPVYQAETASEGAPAPPYSAPQIPPPPSPYSSPYNAAAQPLPDESVHPVLALLLGLIPGVGATYNGQYAKGLVHALVFGLLVSAVANSRNDGMSALLGIMIAAWVFYMCFEAYHTARKRRYGVAVEEFSGQFDFRTGGSRVPVGAILLIGLGFILLLNTTDIISIDEFVKYWPAGLILVGVYLLYNRLNDQPGKDAGVRR
ncbi:MAG TPA: B-box zinc finger protein [Bryobacteraceae bacterium]|nr:B-box zinc finger protein [Bryobacteraceae bacterium]